MRCAGALLGCVEELARGRIEVGEKNFIDPLGADDDGAVVLEGEQATIANDGAVSKGEGLEVLHFHFQQANCVVR